MNLGAQALNAMAEKFGVNNPNLTVPLGVAKSNYVIPPSQALTAFSAIGQFSDTVTPLQEAMLAASIANGGKLMTPYLVKQVTASDLSTVETTSPTQLSQAVSPTVATDLGQMMLAVVQDSDGTASARSSCCAPAGRATTPSWPGPARRPGTRPACPTRASPGSTTTASRPSSAART